MFNSCFWAKKEEKKGVLYWLSLYQHLEDTKEIAGLLWEHWLGEGQRKIIIDSLDEKTRDRAKDLVLFLAAIHDIGKATPVFQIKKGYSNSTDLDIQLLEKLERAGFCGVSSLYLAFPNKTPHNIAGQYLLNQYGVRDDISAIVGGHHGKPVHYKKDIEDQKAYKKNYFQSEDKESEIYQKWSDVQSEIFKWALKESNFHSIDDLPKIKQPAQVILSGLLIMADWIASNDTYFPLFEIHKETLSHSEKLKRVQDGFEKWQKVDIWNSDYNSDYVGTYDKRFGFIPRNVQYVLSDTIDQTSQPGIFILEAPMGSGKTEAALIAAEQLAYRTGRNGLFFGLPTQATSNGIFPRIIHWLDSISEEQHENMGIRLSHGKAYLNEKFTDLAKGIDIDGFNSNTDGTIIVNEWFSGRKTSSLDDFVVGTVDQFLMLALKQKHLALRHLGFSKKVVIIDEVHAYDAYMNQYLLQAIKWMGAYRVPIMILSATLPSKRRTELVKSYMSGMGRKWSKKDRKELQDRLKTDAYPLITYTDGDETYQIKEFAKIENKKVNILRIHEESLVNIVDEAISNGGIVGIIVNTVKRAQNLAKELSDKFGENTVVLLHSAFIATGRVEKENALLEMIGRKGERPVRKIVIGTQVIEQSLDIDFDIMISDLAPMDLLIQRMGRLHRHEIERPEKHKEPIFYILGSSEEYEFEGGASFVYGDYLLARTQDYLPEYIYLPQDISKLVQEVYDFEKDSKLTVLNKDLYKKFEQENNSNIKEKEGKAKIYRIDAPVWNESMDHEENLIGWLNNAMIKESEEKANAQVRDIEPAIEVIALKKIGNGYGLFGTNKDISREVLDYHIGKEIAKNTIILPRSLSKLYNIDKTIEFLEKYTLKNLSCWQESIWLKGSLGIIFDENNEFTIEKTKIEYHENYGLLIKEVE